MPVTIRNYGKNNIVQGYVIYLVKGLEVKISLERNYPKNAFTNVIVIDKTYA